MATVSDLKEEVRNELRADGPQGLSYYNNDTILAGFNNAVKELAGIFTIRDTFIFDSVAEENEYSVSDETDGLMIIDNITKVSYDNRVLTLLTNEEYYGVTDKSDGEVTNYFVWGDTLILIGDVAEAKEIKLWVTRAPNKLVNDTDVPEVPYYAEEALVQYGVSTCYRESRDYDRANFHYRVYATKRDELVRRGSPQGQRDRAPQMRDSYWGAVGSGHGCRRSDTNPGGY